MIDVLLATCKPNSCWLKEQVDSIRAQSGVAVNLVCREDEHGEGARENFGHLLAESKSEYVAFSDQDDVWRSDKLAKCLAKLHALESQYGKDTPLLVFCDGYVTDAGLKPHAGTVISRQRVNVAKGLLFSRLLMQNFIAGNAMLFNAALREKAGAIPRDALMHDVWLALVAVAFGHVAFVDEPLYYYRQHGHNALGATDAGARHFLKRASEGVAAFRARLAENVREAQAFADRFGTAAPATARALAEFPKAGWLRRRFLILRYGLWKQCLPRNLALLLCA